MSPFEAQNRTIRVGLFVDEIDRGARAVGKDPVKRHAAFMVATLTDQWSDEQWITVARILDIRPPSPETKRQVIAQYKRRAERAAVQQSAEVR